MVYIHNTITVSNSQSDDYEISIHLVVSIWHNMETIVTMNISWLFPQAKHIIIITCMHTWFIDSWNEVKSKGWTYQIMLLWTLACHSNIWDEVVQKTERCNVSHIELSCKWECMHGFPLHSLIRLHWLILMVDWLFPLHNFICVAIEELTNSLPLMGFNWVQLGVVTEVLRKYKS